MEYKKNKKFEKTLTKFFNYCKRSSFSRINSVYFFFSFYRFKIAFLYLNTFIVFFYIIAFNAFKYLNAFSYLIVFWRQLFLFFDLLLTSILALSFVYFKKLSKKFKNNFFIFRSNLIKNNYDINY